MIPTMGFLPLVATMRVTASGEKAFGYYTRVVFRYTGR